MQRSLCQPSQPSQPSRPSVQCQDNGKALANTIWLQDDCTPAPILRSLGALLDVVMLPFALQILRRM